MIALARAGTGCTVGDGNQLGAAFRRDCLDSFRRALL